MFGRKYSDGYVDYPGKGRITDEMVAEYVRQHTHWWDRLDYHFVCDCSQLAFGYLIGVLEEPKKKRWYF